MNVKRKKEAEIEKKMKETRQDKYQPSASHTYLYFKEKADEQTDQLQVGFIINFIAGHLSSLGREHELPSWKEHQMHFDH